jgi:hypothetical protein
MLQQLLPLLLAAASAACCLPLLLAAALCFLLCLCLLQLPLLLGGGGLPVRRADVHLSTDHSVAVPNTQGCTPQCAAVGAQASLLRHRVRRVGVLRFRHCGEERSGCGLHRLPVGNRSCGGRPAAVAGDVHVASALRTRGACVITVCGINSRPTCCSRCLYSRCATGARVRAQTSLRESAFVGGDAKRCRNPPSRVSAATCALGFFVRMNVAGSDAHRRRGTVPAPLQLFLCGAGGAHPARTSIVLVVALPCRLSRVCFLDTQRFVWYWYCNHMDVNHLVRLEASKRADPIIVRLAPGRWLFAARRSRWQARPQRGTPQQPTRRLLRE